MAGITYRTCEFDDIVGQSVSDYQQYITDKHTTFRDNIVVVNSQIEQLTDLTDLNTALIDALNSMGISDREDLRARFGLPSNPSTQDERELWLLDVVNTVVIDGRYMMQTPNGIELSQYRVAYNKIGLSTLEADMASGYPFRIHVIHDGIMYSNSSPKAIAHTTGVSIRQLDDIIFVWNANIDFKQRNAIMALGIPGSALFSIMSGRSVDNITTVSLERIDLIDKLRSMGLSTTDLNTLLTRSVIEIVIDTQTLRPGDSGNTLPGPYQDTPYPGETSRAMNAEILMYPTIGEKTVYGATVYVAPVSILVRSLDHEKTFGGADLIRKTSDKIGSDEITGQAVLATHDTQVTLISESFNQWQPGADHFIEHGALAEETMAFFGIGAECGTNTNSGEGFNFWDAVLSSKQLAAIDNLAREWKDITANANFAGDLLGSLGVSFLKLTCESIALGCQGNNILSDKGAEGGPYDQDGGTGVALDDISDVLKTTERLMESFQDIGPNMAVTTIGLGNLSKLRTEPCESPANVGLFNDLERADNGKLG